MTSWAERRILYLDTETYSSIDLRSAGLYRYMEAPDFEVMLLPYAWNDEPVRVLDMFDPEDREVLPDIIAGLHDPDTLKAITKMLEMLEENDDVQNVYHNAELPEEDEEE